MCAGSGPVQFDVHGFDGHLTATGHGIPCIDCQVHDDLFYLPGIDHHTSECGIGAEHQCDVFADQPTKQFYNIGHHFIQVHDFRLQNLPSAEGKQLAGQQRGAVSSLLDLVKSVPCKGIVESHFSQQHVAVTVDD